MKNTMATAAAALLWATTACADLPGKTLPGKTLPGQAHTGDWVTLNEGDRTRIWHALEVPGSGHRVLWTNPSTGMSYILIPGTTYQRGTGTCRHFTLTAVVTGRPSTQPGVACQVQQGAWEFLK